MSPEQVISVILFTVTGVQLIFISGLLLLTKDRVYLSYLLYILTIIAYFLGTALSNEYPFLFECRACFDGFMKLCMGLAYFHFISTVLFVPGSIPDLLRKWMRRLFRTIILLTVLSYPFIWLGSGFPNDLVFGLLGFLGILSVGGLLNIIRKKPPLYVHLIIMGSLLLIGSFILTELLILTIPRYNANPNLLYHNFNTIATILEILLFMVSLLLRFGDKMKETYILKQNLLAVENEALKSREALLRSKINPHFIQNIFSILTINLPVGEAFDPLRKYIYQAGVFFRKTLKVTEKIIHSLDEELEFIEEYLKIQQLVSKNSFSYSIEVDPDIDTYSLQVPTMVLQPLVENSIKHGLAGLDYPGEIRIRVVAESGKPVIVVEDNGMGLSESWKNQQGLGLSLTEKRLEELKKNGRAATFTIENKLTGKGITSKIDFKPA